MLLKIDKYSNKTEIAVGSVTYGWIRTREVLGKINSVDRVYDGWVNRENYVIGGKLYG